MTKFVIYLRVSTQKQGVSGLGLEAQQAAVTAYVTGKGEVIATYTEVETGKRARLDNRPELRKALEHARRIGATLVIAKLDRLARNVHFVSGLMEAGVEFVCCDIPSASRLTIHILAAVAEEEARATSVRTKASLQAYKDQKHVSRRIKEQYPNGVPEDVIVATAGKLGGQLPQCRFKPHVKGLGTAAIQKKTAGYYADVATIVKQRRQAGETYRSIATALNAEGRVTQAGLPYNDMTIHRLLKRSEA